MTRARRGAALALCAGLAVGLAAGLGGGLIPGWGTDGPRQASAPAQPVRGGGSQAASSVPEVDKESVRITAAQGLLSARVAAVRTRNKIAWMATVDLPGSAFGRRQSWVFDNLVRLPLGELSYGQVQLAPTLDGVRARQVGPQAWASSVTGTYSLAGFDRAPRSFQAAYTLVRRAGGWRIADDTDGVTTSELWDLPGLRVLRGQFAMVIGNAPDARMREYRTIADSAVRRVSGVWGVSWNRNVVIVTPATTAQFARLLARGADTGLDQVAAITQGTIDQGQRAQGDRVVINPKAFTALQPIGRRVVISHELTHVAVRSSSTRPVPIWLSEGLADYVGYLGLDLPRRRVAGELLTLIRAGNGPTALPAAADFDPARNIIAPAYSASWLALSLLVDGYGQSRVVAFYREIADTPVSGAVVPPDPDVTAARAFPLRFGVTEPQFVVSWKRYLQALAGSH